MYFFNGPLLGRSHPNERVRRIQWAAIASSINALARRSPAASGTSARVDTRAG